MTKIAIRMAGMRFFIIRRLPDSITAEAGMSATGSNLPVGAGGNCPPDFAPQAREGCYAEATSMIAVANRCGVRSIGLLIAGLLFFAGFQGLAVLAGSSEPV